ncbi:hypothetical protein AMJ80_11655, partial [bacterium SM23_31]
RFPVITTIRFQRTQHMIFTWIFENCLDLYNLVKIKLKYNQNYGKRNAIGVQQYHIINHTLKDVVNCRKRMWLNVAAQGPNAQNQYAKGILRALSGSE